ncbi:hypothetical protein MJO28_013220 [Puccinia striiformis f. sp. tritici]|uniref:Uncharacterized protein n=3 Tax=Puccinia striiformis TaxID=27350 RepID=A0A2S4WBS9_9BASI|nr:hypothetical protein MJO28_013220 [Puccinia striiformis f. sp. tritici]KAI7943027.1 hypothetical protein MJO29_012871 [Puccinia striiformis f. sp. tritici]POW15532.1 hypothetical protein PSTT_02150 [Puccinia striiformis]POW19214.1 hypothetical protein PSHT_04921 [Puccinia striiformis]
MSPTVPNKTQTKSKQTACSKKKQSDNHNPESEGAQSIPTPAVSNTNNKRCKPISWEKDGDEGLSSIGVLLDWLADKGNYRNLCGDNKGGSTKAALALEILLLMEEAGNTHRDNKGIQTKIQELQSLFVKASDWLCHTGAGVLKEDILNGTSTVPGVLHKLCKYWDELQPIMSTHSCANLEVTVELTNWDGVPDLLNPEESSSEDSSNDSAICQKKTQQRSNPATKNTQRRSSPTPTGTSSVAQSCAGKRKLRKGEDCAFSRTFCRSY